MKVEHINLEQHVQELEEDNGKLRGCVDRFGAMQPLLGNLLELSQQASTLTPSPNALTLAQLACCLNCGSLLQVFGKKMRVPEPPFKASEAGDACRQQQLAVGAVSANPAANGLLPPINCLAENLVSLLLEVTVCSNLLAVQGRFTNCSSHTKPCKAPAFISSLVCRVAAVMGKAVAQQFLHLPLLTQ